MKKPDNYFLDTEFFDPEQAGFAIDFISVGLVSQGAAEFYGVSDQIDQSKYQGLWIDGNVIRKLPAQSERLPLDRIRDGILGVFAPAESVDIWAHNGSYDFYVLARIFGGQLKFREALLQSHGIEKVLFRDTKEILRDLPQGFELPQQAEAAKHIAINDARHERAVFNAICALQPLRSAQIGQRRPVEPSHVAS